MPSWFKKVFAGDAGKAAPRPTYEAGKTDPEELTPVDRNQWANPILDDEEDETPVQRKVIEPPVILEEEEMSGWSEEVRIKARPEDATTCTFLVDRPVFEGYSAWFPNPGLVEGQSPLADRIFAIGGIRSVLIHDMTVTVTRETPGAWEDLAKEIGTAIREQLKSGEPGMAESFVEGLPPEDEIRNRIQNVIDFEVNPGIAAHSGVITLEKVKGNTVYITMGGGCQGCAASTITLKMGIHDAFRRAVPQVGAILDETDHASGENPFFKELPPEMRAYA